MAQLTGITATPSTIPAGGNSTINVAVSASPGTPDTIRHINGVVEETGEQASVLITIPGQPGETIVYVLPGENSTPGAVNVRLTCPDGGTLARTGTPGQFTYRA